MSTELSIYDVDYSTPNQQLSYWRRVAATSNCPIRHRTARINILHILDERFKEYPN